MQISNPAEVFFEKSGDFCLKSANSFGSIESLTVWNCLAQSPKIALEMKFYHKKFKKVFLDPLNGVLTTLAFLNCKSPNSFFSGFESEKKIFSFKKNSSKCTSRYVECSFDSQDAFFHRMSGKFLLHFERSHTNGNFSQKRNFQIFSRTVKTIFKQMVETCRSNFRNFSLYSEQNVRL